MTLILLLFSLLLYRQWLLSAAPCLVRTCTELSWYGVHGYDGSENDRCLFACLYQTFSGGWVLGRLGAKIKFLFLHSSVFTQFCKSCSFSFHTVITRFFGLFIVVFLLKGNSCHHGARFFISYGSYTSAHVYDCTCFSL